MEHLTMDMSRSPEATVIFTESVRQIWKIAESAPAKQQTALFLRFSKDLKVAEIAEVMSISEAAVKVHLFRAVQGIRKALCRRVRGTRIAKNRRLRSGSEEHIPLFPGLG
jgi:DNA-directed RNA polymerase specialized sigma24 family protein